MLGTVVALAGPGTAPASAQDARPLRHLDVIEVSGLVDAIVADFVEDAVAEAEASEAVALVVQLNSGGVVVGDRRLARLRQRVRTAAVPVAVWVGPTGARAQGRSFALLDAADVSGVAPGTSVDGPTGRVGAKAARGTHLVDLFSPTLGDFLVDLDGRRVDGEVLQTARVVRSGDVPRRETAPDLQVRFAKLGLVPRLLHTVASPSAAYLLLVVALLLIVFEFFTAGVGVAGAVGAGSFVLAAYGLDALPARGWAVGLLVLGVLGYAIDLPAGAPRAWTVIGTTSFVAGTVKLYDGLTVPWWTILLVVGGVALAMVAGMPAMVRTRFSTPTIGRESMLGELGEATVAVDPEGLVRIRGGLWRARTNRATPIAAGGRVRVVALDGLLLEVEPEEGGARDAGH
jgi:membrane-bound serine protease (ClpP class)